MRHRKIMIAAIAIVSAAGVSGIAAATTSGTSPTAAASSNANVTQATIHTLSATVRGKTETILVNSEGLPLYYYKPDTATKSFVSGELASLWPPLVSSSPTISGATGRVSVTRDSNGSQVAYNGHFLYTFVDDSGGHVSGQGIQNFFVATPALAALATSSTGTATSASTPATIRTQTTILGGRTETVLVNAEGLPLYYYKLDTPTMSFVSGTLASFWPPLVSSNPTITGASGKLSVTHDSNGAQVAYNGHFLYTFANDRAGHASGQGVADFSVATPGLPARGASSLPPNPAATAPPTSGSGMGWGY